MRANDPGTPQLRLLLEHHNSKAFQHQGPASAGCFSCVERVLVESPPLKAGIGVKFLLLFRAGCLRVADLGPPFILMVLWLEITG